MDTPSIPGYRVTGTAGHGVRGAAHTVVGADGTGGVAVIVERELEMRVRELGDLSHPGLPTILDVVRLPDGGAAVVLGVAVGPSLATLVQARGHLPSGELATLWRRCAEALAALHHRGLVHGDVSPGNIVITEAGPVLLDILGHGGTETGPRGHVAPEVAAGAPPTTAADVWGLARAIAWAGGDAPHVLDALGEALADSPAARPTARAFSTWAFVVGDPVPITMPDSAALAGAQVRAGVTETALLAPRRWGRLSLRSVPAALSLRAVAAGVALLLTFGITAGTLLADGGAHPASSAAASESGPLEEGEAQEGAPGGESPGESSTGGGDAGEEVRDPAAGEDEGEGGTGVGDAGESSTGEGDGRDEVRDAVAGVVGARDAALVAHDAAALQGVYAPGASALAADLAVLADVVASGVELRDFGTEVVDVRVVEQRAGYLLVEATVAQRAHTRLVGESERDVAAGGSRCVRLALVRAQGAGQDQTRGAGRAQGAGPDQAQGVWQIQELAPCGQTEGGED